MVRANVLALAVMLLCSLSLTYETQRIRSVSTILLETDRNTVSSKHYQHNESFALQIKPVAIPPRKKCAYAFLVGSCVPEESSCLNYLYDTLITARILREAGSQADIVVFLEISKKTEAEELPDEMAGWMKRMGVRIEYMPKVEPAQETFYRTSLEKFRILGLTEYSRVIFLDGDVIPLNNLDFVFDLSEKGILQENLVVSTWAEPANAGFFMLAPSPTALTDIQTIIADREAKALNMTESPYFDEVVGWGHVIEESDQWRVVVNHGHKGTKWKFYGAFCDQGLLYHYTKYVCQNVSIVRQSQVLNWQDGSLNTTLDNPFKPFSSYETTARLVKNCGFAAGANRRIPCPPLYSDFVHFIGIDKPWKAGPPANYTNPDNQYESAYHVWYHQLHLLNHELDMGLEYKLANWFEYNSKRAGNKLGKRPSPNDVLTANTNLLTPTRRDPRAA